MNLELKKKFRSLRLRMLLVLVGAAGVGVLLFLLAGSVSSFVIRHYYLSEQAVQVRNEQRLENFQEYIEKYHVSGTDKGKIVAWCRANPFVALTVAQNDQVVFNSDGTDSQQKDPFSFVISIGPGKDIADMHHAPLAVPVQFYNGVYSVSVLDMGENRSYLIGACIAVAVGVAGFLAIMLMYNRHVMQSVIRLSHDVNEVSRGNLEMEIHSQGSGELAELADDVNQMRTSIMERMQQENIAWQANRDLITSLSHDLRTPLTALIGYLNLIADGEYNSPEELQSYSHTALDKAMRLKTLSDELFRYFVVYGRPKGSVETEEYDAQILMSQLIGERMVLMTEEGYQFRTADQSAGCRIRVNVDSMMRVMDNLFSNLGKYADPAQPIVIYLGPEENRFCILLSNAFQKKSTESTRIGLQTCKELIRELDGEFSAGMEENLFVTRIRLPLVASDHSTTQKENHHEKIG